MLNAYLRDDFLKKLKKVTVLGGDKRCAVCANMFCELGYECAVYGMEKQPCDCRSTKCVTLSDALGMCDVLILPLPASVDGKHIFCPFSENEISIGDVAELIGPKTLIFAGNLPENAFPLNKKRIINYSDNEKLTALGAICTAEGAIKEISGICEKSLCECKILVSGFGRIGKHLARLLNAYGASVFVSTSTSEKIPLIDSLGYTPVPNSKLSEECTKQPFDVIINTVPSKIFDEKTLSSLAGTPIYIELASKPYGIDFDAAEKHGVCVKKLPGIPGKLYPKSAGRALFHSISAELSKRGYSV